MSEFVSRIGRRRGTRSRLNIAEYLWILCDIQRTGAAGGSAHRVISAPPRFGATPTILLDLPEVAVAQPYGLVAGSVAGASVGALLSLFSRGAIMAIVAAVVAFGIVNLIHAYHPPGVALTMSPLLLSPGHWFPLTVVLPFTVIATGAAALLSRLVEKMACLPQVPE